MLAEALVKQEEVRVEATEYEPSPEDRANNTRQRGTGAVTHDFPMLRLWNADLLSVAVRLQ